MGAENSGFDPVDWRSPSEEDLDAGLVTDEDVAPEAWEEALSFRSEGGPDPPALKGKTLSPKMLERRTMGRESKVPRQIWLRLLSAAELDDLRSTDNRVGMGLLYEAFCLNGNKLWIDPLEELRPIMDNLEKFQGEIRHLRSFIFLLVQLSRAKISPGAFLRYVLRPRMNFDFNYRNWREKNFWALEKIAVGLMELRAKPPFQSVFLGSSRALVEQVLAKYVGKPLARFRTSELDQDDNLNAYFGIWEKLTFSNPFFLDFCRVNVFPFFYRLSGKIDLVQLVTVMKLLQLLEKAVEANLPQVTQPLRKAVLSFSLYTDFEANMMVRQEKGLGPYDMVKELRGFLRSVLGLMATNNGVYLTAWLASVFHAAKDPDLAEAAAHAIPLIADDGGKIRYQCHLQALAREVPGGRETFLTRLKQGRGLHDACAEASLGTVSISPGVELPPKSLPLSASSPFKSVWKRVISKSRPLSGLVLQGARKKTRAEVWTAVYSLWDVPASQDFRNMAALLQAEEMAISSRIQAWKNQLLQRDSPDLQRRIEAAERSLHLPRVLLKNLGFFNPYEGKFAAFLAGVRWAERQPGWGFLASSIAQGLWLHNQDKSHLAAFLKDASPDRPSPAHYAHHLNLVASLKGAVLSGWQEKTRHIRPQVLDLLVKLAGTEANPWGPGTVFNLLDKLFRVDAVALDRARYQDALLVPETCGEEVLHLRHWQGDPWRTGAFSADGTCRFLANWDRDGGGAWTLREIRSDEVVLQTWGQNDILGLYAAFRLLWETWSAKSGVSARIPEGQWRWVGLGELPAALRVWEQKVGGTGKDLQPGVAQRLLDSLK